MKTSELIDALAGNAIAQRRAPIAPPMIVAMLVGVGVSVTLLLAWLGVRDLNTATATSAFWMKSLYTGSLAIIGFMLVRRLARPGGSAGPLPFFGFAVLGIMAILAVFELARTPTDGIAKLLVGHTLKMCSIRIIALAVPTYAAVILVLRRMAPTRLGLCGAAAGMLAGGAGATIYGLYCDETAATFVTAWYTLGIAVCAALGAWGGRYLLRW